MDAAAQSRRRTVSSLVELSEVGRGHRSLEKEVILTPLPLGSTDLVDRGGRPDGVANGGGHGADPAGAGGVEEFNARG